MQPGKSIISPIVVGRTRQIEILYQLAEQTAAGSGQIVLLAGDAGTGKTRLLASLKSRVHTRGWRILEGKSFELDRGLPYAPLLDMLRGFLRPLSASELQRAVGANLLPEVARLAPELSARVSGLELAPMLEPEQEKHRRFETLIQFLTRLADERPLLSIVEDLHWSDDTSLEFLQHFASRISEQPILLVLTLRNEDMHAGLAHFLAALDHLRLANELALTPLARGEVDEMLRAIFEMKRPVRAEFLDAIYTLTEGNPFFIEEVLKSLLAAGDIFYTGEAWDRKPIHELHIPRSVQDAVQQRSQGLQASTRQVLQLAAVFGRRFDFALLQTLLGMGEVELLQSLKELIAAQLVVAESEDRFAFRHALTREAVYAMLLARERRSLHQQIAELLEQSDSSDLHTADLAYHYYAAGAWDKAMHYSQRAGEKAQTLYAPGEALEHFTHAITAATHLHNPVPPNLYRERGRAYETVGNFENARTDYLRAYETATATQDGTAKWSSLIDLGFLWASRDYAQTGEYFRRALEHAIGLNEPRLLAHSLNRVGNWLANMQEPSQAQAKHLEALEIFESLADEAGVAGTLDLLGMANNIGGDLMQSNAYLERAIVRFQDLDDRRGLASALTTRLLRSPCYQTNTMVAAATLREGAGDGERALAIAREIGQRSAEAYALWALASCLAPAGEYGRALKLVHAARQVVEEIEHGQWMSASNFVLGALYLDLLLPGEAQNFLETSLEQAQASGSAFWRSNAAGSLARAYLLQGNVASAYALLDDIQPSNTQAKTTAQRGVQAARIELILADGQPEVGLQMVEELIADAPNSSLHTVIPRLETIRGDALLALGRDAEAEAALEAARGAAVALGLRSLVWQIDLKLARRYAASSRQTESDSALDSAQATIAELAASLDDAALRDHFLTNVHALVERALPHTTRRAKKSSIELTARELEIAKLVAQGKSSREIANELVLSQRTVETHVSNILSKLGFNARTQIATWVTEQGMTK